MNLGNFQKKKNLIKKKKKERNVALLMYCAYLH